ncbi:MAG TPA: glycosyl hydrolase [Polyangiaceae bacterium]|jgi:hypothetical protein|nr:glycosyl hydrolase [Polyangiaceae bacterium]
MNPASKVFVFAITASVLGACGADSTGSDRTDAGPDPGGEKGGAGNAGGLSGLAGASGGGGAADSVGSGGVPGVNSTGGATSSSGGTAGIAGMTASGGSTAMSGNGGTADGGARPTGGAGGAGPGGTDGGIGTGGVGGAIGGDAGTSAGCNVSPVNPNATKQAKNLLCYIYSQYGNHVLSGQQETSWSNPDGDIGWYSDNGMKAPAILGGDYLYPNGTSARAIAYWNAGGITMIRYHMGAPPSSDTYENAKGSANIDNVVRDGTTENISFRSKLDYAAGELKKLQDANVAVIWAPFHEVQPNGWFWWAKGSGAQFVSLWKYMFDYFTETKGLNNVIWLLPFSGSPNSTYYPGSKFLDLSGPDTYDTNQPFTALFGSAKSVIGTTMPIPLHETGLIPSPSAMFPGAAPWVLFNIWAGYQSDGTHNDVENIKKVYADAHTVTRDEVPGLK